MCWLKQSRCAYFHLLFCSEHRQWKEQIYFQEFEIEAFLNVLHFYKNKAYDFCMEVQIKAKCLSWHEMMYSSVTSLCRRTVLCYKITGYFSSCFQPFVLYFLENRIHATVTNSLHPRSSVLVHIITSPLTSSSVGLTQSRSRPIASFDPTASL